MLLCDSLLVPDNEDLHLFGSRINYSKDLDLNNNVPALEAQ